MSPPDATSAPSRPDGQAAQNRAFVARRMKFLIDEGVLAVLEPGRGDSGVFVVSSGGPRDAKAAPVVPQVVLSIDQYGRIARMLGREIPIKIEMDVRNKFHDGTVARSTSWPTCPGPTRRTRW